MFKRRDKIIFLVLLIVFASMTLIPQLFASAETILPQNIKIEAENYSSMSGIRTENCIEGGLNVGWIDKYDYLKYNVNLDSSLAYKVLFRVASIYGTGKIVLRSNGIVLATTNVPNTGGWQNWTTIYDEIRPIVSGPQEIEVIAIEGGFNINWIEFQPIVTPVTVTEPKNGAVFRYNTLCRPPFPFNFTTVFKVKIIDTGKQVSKVEYYCDGAFVGSTSDYPYDLSYICEVVGRDYATYSKKIIAKVIYTDGSSASTPSVFQIYFYHQCPTTPPPSITPTQAPTPTVPPTATPVIAITEPINSSNLHFTARTGIGMPVEYAYIPIKVKIRDTMKSINSVQFYVGDTLDGTAFTYPYTYVWKYPLSNPTGAVAKFRSKVVYDDGTYYISDISSVNISVTFIDATPTPTPPPTPIVTPSPVPTPSPPRYIINEAENYFSMYGIKTQSCIEGGQNVGWIDKGDFMDYRLYVYWPGQYKVQYRVASIYNSGKIDLKQGDTVLASANVPNTGGWQNWTTITSRVNLNFGFQNLRVYANSGGFNVNWIRYELLERDLPGLIEAEDYNSMSGIQTENCIEGGLNVGWIDAGDYLEYNVVLKEPGMYSIHYRVASIYNTGKLEMKSGYQTLGPVINIPNTGGWQNWTTLYTNAYLKPGLNKIRINAVGGGFNINWVKFSGPIPPPDSDVKVVFPRVGQQFDYIFYKTPGGDAEQFGGFPIHAQIKNTGKAINKVEYYNNSGIIGESYRNLDFFYWTFPIRYNLMEDTSNTIYARACYSDGTYATSYPTYININVSEK